MTIELLLRRGTNPESKDFFGRWSLRYIVDNGDVATVQYLLDYGAEIKSKDNRGQTALQLAQSNHDEATITLP